MKPLLMKKDSFSNTNGSKVISFYRSCKDYLFLKKKKSL